MKFLEDLQKSIFKKNGMYMVYILFFLLSFLIQLPDYKMYVEMFRFFYAIIGFVAVLSVYVLLKKKRTSKDNSVIKVTLAFFLVLASATGLTFFKNFL